MILRLHLTTLALGAGVVAAGALAAGVPAPTSVAVAAPQSATQQAGPAAAVAEQSNAEQSTGIPSAVDSAVSGTADLETALAIADELDTSPMYVEERMANRYPQATFDALAQQLAATEHPTYLAFMGGIDYDQGADFATLLSSAHGGEGTYLVVSADGMLNHAVTLADPEDESLVNQQFYRWTIDPDDRMSDIEWLQDVLDRLADPQEIEITTSPFDRLQSGWYLHPERYIAVAAVALLALLAVVWVIARKRPVKARKYRIPDAVMDAARSSSRQRMRDVLGEDALRIAEKLEALQTAELTGQQSETVQRGLDAFGMARRIAEDESSREDDLVGSLVLFDIAERSLEAVERQRSARLSRSFTPRGLCTVNPRHGEARTSARVEAGTRHGSLPLPMCRKCAHDHKAGNPLQWLRVDGAPYPDRSTVWARTLYGATEAELVAEVIRARALT